MMTKETVIFFFSMGLSAPVKEHDPAYVYAQEN